MSIHKKHLTDLERQGLELHGLDVGTPSQLSDCFRHGVSFALNSTAAQLAAVTQELEQAKAELQLWQETGDAIKLAMNPDTLEQCNPSDLCLAFGVYQGGLFDELAQAKAANKRPAPCANHCEQVAFKHEINRLKRELERAKNRLKWEAAEISSLVERLQKSEDDNKQLKQSSVVMPNMITDILRNSYNVKALSCECWTVDHACYSIEQFYKALATNDKEKDSEQC